MKVVLQASIKMNWVKENAKPVQKEQLHLKVLPIVLFARLENMLKIRKWKNVRIARVENSSLLQDKASAQSASRANTRIRPGKTDAKVCCVHQGNFQTHQDQSHLQTCVNCPKINFKVSTDLNCANNAKQGQFPQLTSHLATKYHWTTNCTFLDLCKQQMGFLQPASDQFFNNELENTTQKSVDAKSVQVILEFFDGAQVNNIFAQSEGKLGEIQTKARCNKNCNNGIVSENTCQCTCFNGFSSSSSCLKCTDKNADPADQCESCSGNFRKNTQNECSLCKFGFTGSDCSQCLPNLDKNHNCQRSTCINPKIKGMNFHARTLFAWDASENELVVENAYMKLEGIVPKHMQNRFVFLPNSNITMFLNESHRHTVQGKVSSQAIQIKENWWIWTIPVGTHVTPEQNATSLIQTPTLPFASALPMNLLYQSVYSAYDITKYVLAPYTKHRYTGNANCTKIDSALLQKVPLAQEYTNFIPRTISNDLLPNPGCNTKHPFKLLVGSKFACYKNENKSAGSCACACENCASTMPLCNSATSCGTKVLNDEDCASRCQGQFAWTLSTISGNCSCYNTVPKLNHTATKPNVISGGIFNSQKIIPCAHEHHDKNRVS